ncbi:MAG: YibE/F family protein [Clostridium butyricum]|nr:YibE/F family protein [Clostridium butyricum]
MISKLFNDKPASLRKGIILLLAVCFFTFLYFFNQVDKVQLVNRKNTSFEKAVVQEIIENDHSEYGSSVGKQRVKLKLLSGEHRGKVIYASSFSGYLYGTNCTENMRVIVSLSVFGDDYVASVYGYDRSPIIYGFIGLFLLILCIIGSKKGFKSAISLIFTFICIIFLFIPMIYRGYSPFLSAVIIVILVTIVSMYLIDGITIKSISAILGTVIGVIIAGIFASGFGHLAKISGYNVSDIEELVFVANNTNLKIGGLLFSGILIASLGAIMDVSMSVASTINEIHYKKPNLSSKELFKSGINVGKDMMGTMSNTLILAFTGGSINTLILNYSYDMQYNQVINMYSIGIEIMQGISGSIGVILAVPLVAFITSFLLTNDKLKSSKPLNV